MAMRGKVGAFCQVLLLAASVSALSTGIVHAQQANDLDALNEQILNNPTDVDLNLRYAAAAEAAGKPLDDLSLAELQAVDPRITEAALACLSVESSVASRTSAGGTAPERVREAIAAARSAR